MERTVYKVRATIPCVYIYINIIYSMMYFELVMFITMCRHCVNVTAYLIDA